MRGTGKVVKQENKILCCYAIVFVNVLLIFLKSVLARPRSIYRLHILKCYCYEPPTIFSLEEILFLSYSLLVYLRDKIVLRYDFLKFSTNYFLI